MATDTTKAVKTAAAVKGATNLRQRTLSALVLAPVVLLAVYAGGIAYVMLVTIAAVVGLSEWLQLADAKAGGDMVFLSFASLLLVLVLGAWQSPATATVLGAVLLTAQYFLGADNKGEKAGWIAFGLPYMAGFGLSLIYLRAIPDDGFGLVIYLLLVVWATDIGAYVAGRLFGGPKLAPSISPNKTWAGLVGGAVLAALCGYGVAWYFIARLPLTAIILAVVLAVVSQSGDLFESWAKRRSGVKESGNLIPGHGGLLDRIDGMISAAIFFALFQATAGPRIGWW